ncbi:MAG: peptide-binding protein [Deltaproteobacteria bacterium]|nr:peptide-binding protein [Deltaproteobacteria bacterium]
MRNFYRSFFILISISSLSFISCNRSNNSTSDATSEMSATNLQPVKNDWMVSWLAANPTTLNPILKTDAYASAVVDWLFDSLIRFDPKTAQPEGRLAESWEVSKDGLTYDFTLRPGITFHDGHPLTTEDVKFTFDTIKNPKVDAAHLQNYFASLKSVEVLSPLKVRFHLKEIYYRNLIMLGLVDIMPKHIYGVGDFNKNAANRKPIGSGPYVFKSWDNGQSVELVRNKNYFGNQVEKLKNLYNFERLVFRIITEPSVALMALKKGDIDAMEPTTRQYYSELATPEVEKKFYRFRYDTADGNGHGFIGWNLRLPLFQSKEVRQALAYAMPREEINKKIYFNSRTLAVGTFPKVSPKSEPSLQPIPYDSAKAKALLEKAGWKINPATGIFEKDGKKFSFELLFGAGNSDSERVALIYQQALKQIGIEMNIRTLEWTVFVKQMQAFKFDALMMGWGGALDMDPYQIWHSSQANGEGSNFIGFKNPEADKLMEQARVTLDPNKRNKLYHQFSKILAEEAPYLFLFEVPSLFVGSKRFQGILPVPLMGLDSAAWFTPKGMEKYKEQ